MASTIDWATLIITIPKADTSLVDIGPPEIRSLNVNMWRLGLKDIEDDEDGMAFLDTHQHTAPVTIGGVTLARVVEVINGYTVTFENGSYAVNLEGANQNIGDVINFNSVQIRSTNSAGLTFSKQIEDQSFTDDRIYIDISNGQTGIAFPLGTPGFPVNNLADAQTIISNRTLPKKLHITGTLVIGATEDISDYNIQGAGSVRLSLIVFTAGAVTTNAAFFGIDLTGTQSGRILAFERCLAGNLLSFEGALVDAGIEGTITLTNTDAEDRIAFIDCVSISSVATGPIIDCNSLLNLNLIIKGYKGPLNIKNVDDASMQVNIDSESILLTIDSSCTAGNILVRGVGKIVDNSAGSTIDTEGFVESENLKELWKLQGLDIDNPMTVTPTSRDAGADVAQTISGDGSSTSTVTRDP